MSQEISSLRVGQHPSVINELAVPPVIVLLSL